MSLAVYGYTSREGVIACPQAVLVRDRNGTFLASRNPWTDCTPNALNTILFFAATNDSTNATTLATGENVETDFLSITLINALYYSVALTEIQIWVPSNPYPRYEVEDGLLGTFIGGFEGKKSGLNCTIQDGGVVFGEGGWAEVANVRTWWRTRIDEYDCDRGWKWQHAGCTDEFLEQQNCCFRW